MSAPEQLAHKATLLRRVRRVVIKIGSTSISDRNGIDRSRLEGLVAQIADVAGRLEVAVVTSGAVAAGVARLGGGERPRSIPQRQAAAAVGQIDLMAAYEELFDRRGKRVAQILLTHDDLAHRQRYINAKHTLQALLQAGIVPIANENDTVAIEELNFGDNDNLSALVATLIDADLLIILSDVAGVYDRDPRQDPEARLLPVLPAVTRAAESLELSSVTGPLGRGGMAAKVSAARKASAAGIATVIADSARPGVLAAILDPAVAVGTLILPGGDRLRRRKHWIAHNLKPCGTLVVDQGAYEALRRNGGSLLPRGLAEVRGVFPSGACVRCVAPDGREFARGLVSYPSADLERIKGLHTHRIEEVLGYRIGDEVIHRDDLALLEAEA